MAPRASPRLAACLCLVMAAPRSEAAEASEALDSDATRSLPSPLEECDMDFPCKAVVSICPGLTTIPHGAFLNCAELAEVHIPDSVTDIGHHAFQNCTKLAHVVLPSSLTTIARGVFDGCSSLSSVYVPSSVTAIKEAAFKGCRSLHSPQMPVGLKCIGRRAFANCSTLQKVIVPSSVATIGDRAFEGCDALARATVEMPFPELGEAVFPNLTDISYNRPLDAELPDEQKEQDGHDAEGTDVAAAAEGNADESSAGAEHSEEIDGAIAMAAVTAKGRWRPSTRSRWQGKPLGAAGVLMVVVLAVARRLRQGQSHPREASAAGALGTSTAGDHDALLAGAV